jgi:RNA polymerase subunit RPABC4/transcription elongation factor Spt4
VERKMLVCIKCNIEYEDGKEVCSGCGSPLLPQEKPISNDEEEDKSKEGKPNKKLICPSCKLLYEKMTFCIRCGSTLVEEIPSQQGEEPEPSYTPEVNPSTPRPERQGLLRVDPEPRFLTPSLKMGLGAAERVNRI